MPNIEKRGTAQTLADLIKPGTIDSDNRQYSFDFKKAPELIREAIANHEPITVIGDYDCDGVCASAIMKLALKELSAEPVVRLPHRFSEGYGMKPAMVDEIKGGLIITVDNGIAAHEAIQTAKDKGLKVIVTDHHLPVIKDGKIVMPNADCVIDPHVEAIEGKQGYDFHDYCGAGIALKLSEELLGKDHSIMDKLYSLAAVATIADVVPLTNDNRRIYIRGTEAIHEQKMTAGLKKLFECNKINTADIPEGIKPHTVLSTDIMGFRIGPCVNAASRMEDTGASKALDCLATDASEVLGFKRAAALVALNEKRKTLYELEHRMLQRQVDEKGVTCPMIVHLPDSGPGIIGLHAGRLCEDYKVPVVVINGHGDNCKGSCRSPEGAHMKELLDECAETLVAYGGHSGAAGLTIKEEQIPEFTKKMTEACQRRGIKPLDTQTVYYDVAIDAAEIPYTLSVLERMAPFGEGNPEPVFAVKNFKIEESKILGGKHIKLTGESADAIGFGLAENGTPEGIAPGDTTTLIGRLSYNVFRDSITPQVGFDVITDESQLAYEDRSYDDISEEER